MSCPVTDNWTDVRAAAEAVLTPKVVAFIAECRTQPHAESQLIEILHRVQSHFGYLGATQLDAVAQLLQVPAAKVSGVATFYHFFRLQPVGRFKLSVCLGTACYVKGAEALVSRFKEELGINFGETSKDGLFTLEASRCLGTCGLAPVMMVGNEVHGTVTPDQVPLILRRYIARAKETKT